MQKCNKNHYKPDLHTFFIDITGGRAYVECRGYEVYIEHTIYDIGKTVEWCGTVIAATNRLEALGAIYDTIDM